MSASNIDKLKAAESAAIQIGNDPVLRSMSAIRLLLLPALIDLIQIVRQHEQRIAEDVMIDNFKIGGTD